jgi:hypothetical protein
LGSYVTCVGAEAAVAVGFMQRKVYWVYWVS